MRNVLPLVTIHFLGADGKKISDRHPPAKELAAHRKMMQGVLEVGTAFLRSLTPGQRRKYRALAAPELSLERTHSETRPPMLDGAWAQLWVAKRTYDLGWTKDRFPSDSAAGASYSPNRPLIERIGKKYQHIALFELLARLADTFWLINWSGEASVCRRPTQLGLVRDIDPTLFAHSLTTPPKRGEESSSLLKRAPAFSRIGDRDLLNWPMQGRPLNESSLIDIDGGP